MIALDSIRCNNCGKPGADYARAIERTRNPGYAEEFRFDEVPWIAAGTGNTRRPITEAARMQPVWNVMRSGAPTRQRRLQRIINNSRLLVLPWVRLPNLLSHLFKRLARQLPHDWHQRYRITPVMIETFVETPRFAGTAYKASGWIHVGTTQGRGRQDTRKQYALPKKHIWLKPLRKNWQRLLND